MCKCAKAHKNWDGLFRARPNIIFETAKSFRLFCWYIKNNAYLCILKDAKLLALGH